MKDDIFGKAAIAQRTGETYAIIAPLLGGIMDIDTAKRIAEVSESLGVKTLKVTGAQRLALFGIREEDIDAAYDALGAKPQIGAALCQQYVKVCPGSTFCARGQRDTIAFAQRLTARFHPFPKITSKVKIGIAGCFNSCVEPAIKDIGLIGLSKGWIMMIGGAGGKDPMLGEVVARNLTDDQVLDLLDPLLKYYRAAGAKAALKNERLGIIMKTDGRERLLNVLGLDG